MPYKTKNFSKIDKLINNTAKQYHLESALNKYQVMKHWKTVVGVFVEEAVELTQAMDFKKGVLVIACLSKELAGKLRLLAVRIIASINQLLGKLLVFALHIEV